MRKQNILAFLSGVIVTLLAVSLAAPAVASLATRNIQVYTGISVYVNDQKVRPKDANGNPVEVFVYNGTTYLPIRAIGEALGMPVAYDSATTSAYVGRHASTQVAAWLSQLDYFSGDASISTAASETANTGTTYDNCITASFDRTYLLNGQYSSMTGTVYQAYDYRSDSGSCSLTIYGDDTLLYTHTYSGTGMMPADFYIDLSNVQKLRVEFTSSDNSGAPCDYFSLGNVGLHT